MEQQAKASLVASLNDLLKDEFDGVPTNSQIALALRKIIANGDLPVREAILLDALSDALTGGSGDGWKFRSEVAGPKGPRRSKERGRERRAIGERFAVNLAEGGDEYARKKAKEEGDRSAKEAYSEHRPARRLARFMDARTSHENRIEELRSKLPRALDTEK